MADFDLRWNAPQVSATVRQNGADGVGEALDKLLASSNDKVPVDTGELKGSGSTRQDGLAGEVRYSAEHAAVVHENLEAHHSSGQAKFLEVSLTEGQNELLAVLAGRLRITLNG